MKQQIFRQFGSVQNHHLHKMVDQDPMDGSMEWVYRNSQVSKTLAQLGTLFGIWLLEIEQQTGAQWTIDTLHRFLKNKFLVQIYCKEQSGPHQARQVEWFEHLELLLEIGDEARTENHIKRVSLSWASKEQHSEYLHVVWNWAMENGFRLTIPDKYHKVFRRELEQ